jgi:oxygen-independent coproporphyrinogen-3 oxidase
MLGLLDRPVEAVYFGGGTANLCETESFRKICRELRAFDLKKAEITLEGVPAYFFRGSPLLLEILRDELQGRSNRLSMGIQTFDPVRLAQMGRTQFGDAAVFREVVELAHRFDFTASADLLFNLPGQTLEEMKSDVLRAIDIGVDHLGLYNLVLFRGLGSPWARDESRLAEQPSNAVACENWLALRQLLLERHWSQTSLTNFEHPRQRNSTRRFQYEELSFSPDANEAIGFGPGAISYSSTDDFRLGMKVINPERAGDYQAAVKSGLRIWDRAFDYDTLDQKVHWLARRLAALEIDRHRYHELFLSDACCDFQDQWDAIEAMELVTVTNSCIRPTPKGMFYADSIAAVLASPARKARASRGARALPADLMHDIREERNFQDM